MTVLQEFKVQQRRTCLDKAETILQKLKPHFEHFVQVSVTRCIKQINQCGMP